MIIYTDDEMNEIGYLPDDCQIDMEVGLYSSESKNDFELTIKEASWDARLNYKSLIYEEENENEIGGRIQGITSDTQNKQVKLYGYTWRGLISKKVVCPPKGEAYYRAAGDANAFLRDVLDNEFDGLIVGSSEDYGLDVSRNLRYVNTLDAIEKTLEDIGCKLKLSVERINDGEIVTGIRIVASAAPIIDYSGEMELNNDYGYYLIAKDIKDGYNHIICLGGGEMEERTVIEMYMLSDGTITQSQSEARADGIEGINERVYLYDYSSVESDEELESAGKQQLKTLADTKSFDISNVNNIVLGDKIGARDLITDIYMMAKIGAKVITGYLNKIKIESKVEQ